MLIEPQDKKKLEKAVTSGARRVRFQDGEVEYHDPEKSLKVLSAIERTEGKGPRMKIVKAAVSKGLEP